MTTNTMQKAAGATNTNGPHTYTNGVDFRTSEVSGQAPDAKDFAGLQAFARKLGVNQ